MTTLELFLLGFVTGWLIVQIVFTIYTKTK